MSKAEEVLQSEEIGEEPGVEVDAEGAVIEQGQKDAAEDAQATAGEDHDEPIREQELSEEDREAIRQRRREDRQRKKHHRQEVVAAKDRLISSLQRQNQDLASRLSHIEQRQRGVDVARLDADLSEAISTAEEAKRHLGSAAESADGTGVADATELYYAARRKAEYLGSVKQKLAEQARAPQAPQLDQEMVNHAAQWMNKNKWYNPDPRSVDEDSAVTRAVDSALVAEGYDPRTREYWEELSDRVSRRLPHRFEDAKGVKNGKNGSNAHSPVGGSGKESTSPGEFSKFYVSPERVRAMRDAGIWEDDVKRAAMLKKYQQYDKAKGSR